MKTTIGITWYPRKGEVFQQMQHSIKFDNCIVYPDGVEFPHRTDFEVRNLGDHKGCFKHYHRVLTDLCETDSDIVGILPDDIIFKDGWLELAHNQFKKNPYIGYLALFTPRGMGNGIKHSMGWNEIKGGWATSWGGGYLYERKTAKKILKHPFILDHLENYEANQQIDHAIPEAVHQMGLFQFIHNPSLLKHIGTHSTIGHTHRRKLDEPLNW